MHVKMAKLSFKMDQNRFTDYLLSKRSFKASDKIKFMVRYLPSGKIKFVVRNSLALCSCDLFCPKLFLYQ